MKHKRSQVEQQKIFIRRQQVLELASDGYTERNIAAQLHIPLTTVHRDITFFRSMAKKTIDNYIQVELPFRHLKCLTGFDSIIREMSEVIKDENVDLRSKIHAATVKMQAYKHTLEMMDLTVGVDNAIKFLDRYREDTLNSMQKAQGIQEAFTPEQLEQRRREAIF
jgi:hypothetical protein